MCKSAWLPSTFQPQNIEEKLEKKLQEAKVLETSSVLQCERLYKEIIEEAKENLGADQPVTVKVNCAYLIFMVFCLLVCFWSFMTKVW